MICIVTDQRRTIHKNEKKMQLDVNLEPDMWCALTFVFPIHCRICFQKPNTAMTLIYCTMLCWFSNFSCKIREPRLVEQCYKTIFVFARLMEVSLTGQNFEISIYISQFT